MNGGSYVFRKSTRPPQRAVACNFGFSASERSLDVGNLAELNDESERELASPFCGLVRDRSRGFPRK